MLFSIWWHSELWTLMDWFWNNKKTSLEKKSHTPVFGHHRRAWSKGWLFASLLNMELKAKEWIKDTMEAQHTENFLTQPLRWLESAIMVIPLMGGIQWWFWETVSERKMCVYFIHHCLVWLRAMIGTEWMFRYFLLKWMLINDYWTFSICDLHWLQSCSLVDFHIIMFITKPKKVDFQKVANIFHH